MYKCSLERMTDKINTFSKYGDAGHGGITRYSLSPEALMARKEFEKRMKAIGSLNIPQEAFVAMLKIDEE